MHMHVKFDPNRWDEIVIDKQHTSIKGIANVVFVLVPLRIFVFFFLIHVHIDVRACVLSIRSPLHFQFQFPVTFDAMHKRAPMIKYRCSFGITYPMDRPVSLSVCAVSCSL